MLKEIKLNLLTIIIIVIVLVVGIGVGFYKMGNNIKSMNIEISDKNKTNRALNDSVRFYVNKYNEIVAEKLTLQGKVKDIIDKNNKLTENQNDLMKRVVEINKKNVVIAAANVKLIVMVDSLRSVTGIYNPLTKSVPFSDSTSTIKYKINVSNIAEIINKKPTLQITDLYLPNIQKIDFHWSKDSKLDHPVSFSVVNTNKYFKVNDIDSYIIPEINKNTIKPNGWEKIGNFFKNGGSKITIFGTGVGVGALAIFLLTR